MKIVFLASSFWENFNKYNFADVHLVSPQVLHLFFLCEILSRSVLLLSCCHFSDVGRHCNVGEMSDETAFDFLR